MAETTAPEPKTRATRKGKSLRRHPPKRIDEGLLALLLTGSSVTAAEQTGIPEQTLRDWRYRYGKRHAELAKKYGPQLEAEAIASLQEVAIAATRGTLKAVEVATRDIEGSKDPAATARNLATVVGITTEKALLLQGKPTSVTDNVGTRDILKALGQRVPGLVVEGTAEEIPEAVQTEATTARSNGAERKASLPAT